MVATATKPVLVVIVGPTASGKSSIAMELAKKYGSEIICADSRTVYKGMDIGTAKPTPADQATIRHHLIDVAEPDDAFTAADFKTLANQAIEDIVSRAKIPILVGGTGLYVDGVLYNFEFGGQADQGLRAELEAQTDEELVHRAESLGVGSDQVNFQNRRHLMRAIERGGVITQQRALRANTLVLGVRVDPDALRERISLRVDSMVANGLEQEVHKLLVRYGWDDEAMSAIGYKEWQAYFDGQQTLEHTIYLIKTHTSQYAKRQRTWFNRGKSIHWIQDVDQADRAVGDFLLQ